MLQPPLPTQPLPQPIATPQPQRPVPVAVPMLQPTLPTPQPQQPVAIPAPLKTELQPPPLKPPPIHIVLNPPTQGAVTMTPARPPVAVERPPTVIVLPLIVGGDPQRPPVYPTIPPTDSTVSQVSGPKQPAGEVVAKTQPVLTGSDSGEWVVSSPGRQRSHNLPTRVSMDSSPRTVHCLASGFGWRREQMPDGTWRLAGAHPDLRTMDTLVRDIPANHHLHSGCVVEVVRRELTVR